MSKVQYKVMINGGPKVEIKYATTQTPPPRPLIIAGGSGKTWPPKGQDQSYDFTEGTAFVSAMLLPDTDRNIKVSGTVSCQMLIDGIPLKRKDGCRSTPKSCHCSKEFKKDSTIAQF